MNLQQQQAFLARLYTDQALSQRIYENPREVARDFELPVEWVEELLETQSERLKAFQKSLVGKRRKQTHAILPRSFVLASARLNDLFTEYAQGNSLQDPNIYTRDAWDFRKWAEGKIETPLAELMRFEWEVAEMHRKGHTFKLLFFRYPVWDQHFNLQMPSRKRWVLGVKSRFYKLPW